MIEINTLHIGSHVLYNGKHERVRGLDEDNGLIIRFPAEYVLASEVEPIAITPELLAEFMPENGLSKNFGDFYVFVWKDNDYQIEIKIIGERARVKINRDGYDGVFALATDIHYIHKLEAFLYLTTKTELIKE